MESEEEVPEGELMKLAKIVFLGLLGLYVAFEFFSWFYCFPFSQLTGK
jgi:hypothetical protein